MSRRAPSSIDTGKTGSATPAPGSPPLVPTGERPADVLLHELEVHRAELETQNENLRETQLALEESRDRYIDLYEFAPVGYFTLAPDGHILALNLTAAAILGAERNTLLNKPFSRIVAPSEEDRWRQHFAEAVENRQLQSCDVRMRRQDGSEFDGRLECRPRSTGEGSGDVLRLTLTDISNQMRSLTELKRANQQLEDLAAEQAAHLRELAGELTRAEQSERDQRYELIHGEVQPLLVAARLSLSGLNEHSTKGECLRVARQACDHISSVLDFTRNLSLTLSPPLIRERGLVPALGWLCRWVRDNHGLDVEFHADERAEPDDVAMRVLCFNSVRELLMNTVKHAGTSNATLEVRRADDATLELEVTDEGVGYDPATVSRGAGLAAIERRLTMFGGSLRADSAPGGGTFTTLTAPLHPIAADGWARAGRERREQRRKEDAENTDRR